MWTFRKVRNLFLVFINIDCVLFYHNTVCEVSEYVLTDKNKLAIKFARKSSDETKVVDIDGEFLFQHQMRCLLDPNDFVLDVVSKEFFNKK